MTTRVGSRFLLLLALMEGLVGSRARSNPEPSWQDSAKQIPVYVDAQSGEYIEDQGLYRLSGDVVFIYKDFFIYAKEIRYWTKTGVIEAVEQVVFSHQHLFFLADRLEFRLSNKKMALWNVQLFVQKQQAKTWQDEIFYKIPRELPLFYRNLGQQKANALPALTAIREKVLQHYQTYGFDPQLSLQFQNYLNLKEEITRFHAQEPVLLRHPVGKKKAEQKIKARLAYLASIKDKDLPLKISSFKGQGYIYLKGSYLESVTDAEFFIKEGTLTPCLCDYDEIPAWEVKGRDIWFTLEQYITVNHPVFFLNGIPTFYLPWVRLPVKSTRQSGFLMPIIRSHRKHTGFSFGVQYYRMLDPTHDATLELDYYDRLGNRAGVEYRYEEKQASGMAFGQFIQDRYLQYRYGGLVQDHIDQALAKTLTTNTPELQAEQETALKEQYPVLSKNRYYLKTRHQGWGGSGIMFRSNIELVSDHLYFYHLDGNDGIFPRYLDSYFQVSKGFRDYYIDIMGSVLDDFQSVKKEDTVQRLPEASLFSMYQSILGLPIYYSWNSTLTRFNRLGGAGFDDTMREEEIIDDAGNPAIALKKNKAYDDGEVIKEADRLDNNIKLSVPLFKNRFVSGNVDVGANKRIYRLPYEAGIKQQSHLLYRAVLKVPLDKRFVLQKRDNIYQLEHQITPSIGWEYLPHVNKDRGYLVSFDSIDNYSEFHRVNLSVSTSLSYKHEQWVYQPPPTGNVLRGRQKRPVKNIFEVPRRLQKQFATVKEVNIIDNHSTEETFDAQVEHVNAIIDLVGSKSENNKKTWEIDSQDENRLAFQPQPRMGVQSPRLMSFSDRFYAAFPESQTQKIERFEDEVVGHDGWRNGYYIKKQQSRTTPVQLSLTQPINVTESFNPNLAPEDRRPLEKMSAALILAVPFLYINFSTLYGHYVEKVSPFSEVTGTFTFISPYWTKFHVKIVDHQAFFAHPEDLDETGAAVQVEERLRNVEVLFAFNLLRSLNMGFGVARQLANRFLPVAQSLSFTMQYSPSSACWGIVGSIVKEKIGSPDLTYEARFNLNFHKGWEQSYAITDIIRKIIF